MDLEYLLEGAIGIVFWFPGWLRKNGSTPPFCAVIKEGCTNAVLADTEGLFLSDQISNKYAFPRTEASAGSAAGGFAFRVVVGAVFCTEPGLLRINVSSSNGVWECFRIPS